MTAKQMPSGAVETNIYAIYRGDEFLVVGTASECARYLDIKVSSFYDYVSRGSRGLEIVKLEEEQ